MEDRKKSAMVTGAALGIGRGIALRLAKEGYRQTLLDIREEELAGVENEIQSRYAVPLQCCIVDISQRSQVERAVQLHMEMFGGVDLVVNNAGINLKKRFCEETTDEDFNKTMQVNLYGPFYLCRAVIPYMKAQKYGVIVNISSSAGKYYTPLGGVSYAAAKAGLLGLTRQLAHELAEYHVRVNAICPAAIDTPLMRTLRTDKEMKQHVKNIPIGRFGLPEDIAGGVIFLASDDSSYITGISLDMNGGKFIC